MENKKDNYFSENKKNVEIINNENKVEIIPRDNKKNVFVKNLNFIVDPLKKRKEFYKKESNWHLIADSVLVVILIVLSYFLIHFLYFNPDRIVSLSSQSDVSNITAGKLTVFELDYNIKTDIKNAEVKLTLPNNFILESASPLQKYNQTRSVFELGDMKKGDSGLLKVEGYVIGLKNEHQMISFSLSCDKCGKNEILSSYFYNIDRNFLDININIPETIYNQSEFTAEINIKNNTSDVIENIQIDFENGIKINNSDLEISNNALTLNNIQSNQSNNYSFTAINSHQAENLEMIANISFDFKGQNYKIKENISNIDIQESNLQLEIESLSSVIDMNESTDYIIRYKNAGDQAIKQIKMAINSPQDNLEITQSKIKTDSSNIYLENNIIRIENLLANESGDIELSITPTRKAVKANQEFYINLETEYTENNQKISNTVNSNRSKIRSNINASASARYYSPRGDQLGVGPLPPAISMATTYWVFLDLMNNGNNLEDIVLSGQLTENVYFTQNKRVLDGRLNQAEIGKRFSREIEEIKAENGEYTANFEISFMPTEDNYDQIVDLIEDIKIEGRDSFTGETISMQMDNITSNLIEDSLAEGKGVVVNFE